MSKSSYPTVEYLVNLALKAGSIIRANFALGMKRQWKEDETPLTATDVAVNDLVLTSLGEDYPHVGVISEEGSRAIEGAEYVVLCDPVDGTIPFSLGLPVSTFCISVLRAGEPIIGVVYDPFQDRLWFAEKGKGATLRTTYVDGRDSAGFPRYVTRLEPVMTSACATVNRSNVCMIWWKESAYNLHDVAKELMAAGGHWINPASVAIFGGLIASGTFEASIFPGTKPWETAAMQVLIEEAGGTVTDIHGRKIDYSVGAIEGHIASNGLIHDQLVDMVARCNPGWRS